MAAGSLRFGRSEIRKHSVGICGVVALTRYIACDASTTSYDSPSSGVGRFVWGRNCCPPAQLSTSCHGAVKWNWVLQCRSSVVIDKIGASLILSSVVLDRIL